ncbi:MAG: hypothetical protein A3C93_05995 [Candidatus Lloydbacteria bacterium RIFCSPHIGHO2_02_FULL_54_17]|uniref:SCP domain-containing protein n=1 Tax=Candidatus Lloydbacteria bacterium RIFCSPHIGHO2_02_FULL_54_17 TaxID=1798664 RepID=A0A1G2DG82_9BACT|nr:MAG: hypothetical protein A2762_06295 [Candidatus Lloydbacteria bacterium RIFCSPHIGHO2_01_FULL_54_11]OGZ11961.1 MAG: hypothetical protein A3C93_05995 [Candidatus Lloydbacteria bacterium RIFCSPHIGHO2_02_FULL_54_17]OGZ14216.1 MAG: hypothetical protein A2948_02685 [Candidatus Lloydbacteria bacterium RIFCSPLOWO2_01_FULL_54_18]OGZ15400.1 MAG: hypothetical protein A3H76_03530 [Candidatus Lloydbacteria bacterium RIFCSPLOWO2_02_FULL_54_12]
MRRVFKDHFIPHKGNDYKPHFLRAKVAAGVLAFILVVEGFYLTETLVIFPKSDYLAAIFATVLVEQTNEVRTGQSLAMLTPSPVLAEVARMKAEDMAAKGYFAHNAPDGKTPWYWFRQAGYNYIAAGENLAVNFTDSKDVTLAWLNSPSHRANIVNGNYTEIGIATAQGFYKGKEAVFVVEVFGRPASALRDVLPPSVESATKDIVRAVETKTSVLVPAPALAQPVKAATAPGTPSASVAGADTTIVEDILDVEELKPTVTAQVVSPKVVAQPKAASPVAIVLASPRHLTTTLYFIIGAILLLAIALTIFIEIRIQFPSLVVTGFVLLFAIVLITIFNSSVSLAQGVI